MIIDTEEISLLKDKIIYYERQLIGNNKTLEVNKSQITLLQLKSAEKNKVINSLENRVDELDVMNKKFENQISLQSKTIISYLEKIETLQNNIRCLELKLEETTLEKMRLELAPSNTKTSILKRIFKKINKAPIV